MSTLLTMNSGLKHGFSKFGGMGGPTICGAPRQGWEKLNLVKIMKKRSQLATVVIVFVVVSGFLFFSNENIVNLVYTCKAYDTVSKDEISLPFYH
jgi:hypothetical protein